MSILKIHTTKDKVWVDAAGDQVPYKFVPVADRKKEALAARLHKSSLQVEQALHKLYDEFTDCFAQVKSLIREEFEIKNGKKKSFGKGSITWFNFDRSIKVEANMNDLLKWDDAMMTEALSLLNDYLSRNLTDANVLISGLVQGAFSNSKGQIDTGNVFKILKYEDKIKDKSFLKACTLMRNAHSLDKTKLYMRISEKMSTGEYRNINLNFSSL